ncbi:MAG: ATP-binding protein [Chloroflexota bacterium]
MTTESAGNLLVRSHVGRDVLAQAAQFKTEAAVVWEYVVNSLQYVDPGTQPKVDVTVKPGVITVSDNGAGMDEERLAHFFTMHAENLDRQAGRLGRGKWGTGKSAAFGIANTLRVDTIRGGLRNIVQLTRPAIEASGGEAIPVEWLERNEPVEEPNGTTITIADLVLPRVDKAAIIEYIERNLAAFRGTNPVVAVNSHVCEYHAPPIRQTYTFTPTVKQAATLGDVTLAIHSSTRPLREWEQGVAVLAGPGNLVAIERGGLETKEFGNYLFGEVEVSALETFETPLEPFDPSRSLSLNPRHPVVAVLLGFIGSKLEQVRQELVGAERSAREEEEARRLARQANDLAELLNADFQSQMQRLRDIRAATSHSGAAAAAFGGSAEAGSDTDLWVEGIDEPGVVEQPAGEGEVTGGHQPPPSITKIGRPHAEGDDVVSPAGGEGQRRRPRGGFSVAFRNLGEDEDRSWYDPPTMTIIINKDHPVVAAALRRDGIESISFRRLSYEIAFSEYAIALSYETVNRDPAMPAGDVLYDIRATLKRITRGAAPLYA